VGSNLRNLETGFAYFSLAATAFYAPVETWASLPYGLLSPFYLIDLIAIVLLFAGGVRSLRLRPAAGPGVLCAAWAWAAANGWRATFGRLSAVGSGDVLQFGLPEVWAVGVATAIALGCFALSMFLVIRAELASR
jgi:hypothetical protein